MGSNWPITSLDSHISIKHGFAFKGEFFKDSPTPDCLLTPGNFAIGGGFKGDKYKYYDGPVPSDYVLKAGDLVVTMTDLSKQADTLGYSALIPAQQNKCFLHNQRTGLVQFKDDELDKVFLYFLLRSKEYRHHVVSGATGTTVKHTSPTKILSYKFRKPPKPLQVAIGLNLLSIEKKININHQINQTLEQMAQALFKSWFVDFDPVVDNALDAGFFEQDLALPDELLRRAEARRGVCEHGDFKPLPDAIRQLFPAAFEECAEPSLGLGGWVPQGWNAESLENVTSLIIDHRGKTPKKLGGDWSEIGHPAISAKNIKNGRLVRHDAIKYVDSSLYTRWMKDPLLAGDILMTSEAPLGELLYLVKNYDYLLSQRLYGIRADKDFISGCYLYFWLQTNAARADIDGRATGTTVVGIRQSELKKIKVMVPQKNVLDKFSGLVTNYLEKIESNEEQCIELESLRDTLLPKLISGELRLDQIEADLAKKGMA